MEENNSRVFNCCEHAKINNHIVDCHISIDLCILLPWNSFLKQSGIYELQLKSIFFLKIIYEPFKWSICYFVIIIWMSAFLIIWNTCFPQGLLTGNSKMLFYNLLVMVSFIFIYIYILPAVRVSVSFFHIQNLIFSLWKRHEERNL